MTGGRVLVPGVLAAVLVATTAVPSAAAPGGGPAPGAPGIDEQYLPADKAGFGTATSTRSTTWFTVQKSGGLAEIFYPDLGSPAARSLSFVVADRRGHAVRAGDAADVRTTVADGRSLSYRQTFTERGGRWRLTARYATDPDRSTVLVDLRFVAAHGRAYDVYALYDPALANSRGNDAGRTDRDALVAVDGPVASAFVATPGFTATSNGFAGTSDGWADLRADGRLDGRYTSAAPGSLVQTARTALTGRPGREHTTIALGFGPDATAALGVARASLRPGFAAVAAAYARGWHRYLDGLRPAPSSVDGHRQLYRTSAMVLAAAEDKTHRGAYAAAPAAPWAFGRDDPSGPYHLVWSRDLYQIAHGLIAAGDLAGANRAVDYLFGVQQKPDGSFPQNSKPDGTPVWEGLQLDEVALPIVLAYQLQRTDARTVAGVRKAADFLLSFSQDGVTAPWTPAERWENQAGYSPNTIATEIAALVCAAELVRTNGDTASATRYLATADDWQAKVKGWTVTTTGPYSSDPYFLRLTKDGNPDAGTTYTIGDSGPSDVDQRRVVDPSFLELVRLGVLPADDPAVVNTLRVVDAQLGYPTRNGFFWHRASFDGFGEKANGDPWDYGLPDDSLLTRGRGWPLLNGERGQYRVVAGDLRGARRELATMARAAGPGFMLPEQVWDQQAPPGAVPGTPTTSATPLTWTHAQFLRLAWSVQTGRVAERPEVVARRYAGSG